LALVLLLSRTTMDLADKAPTIPIPFHTLLKVVAIVDGQTARRNPA